MFSFISGLVKPKLDLYWRALLFTETNIPILYYDTAMYPKFQSI